ncbi:MAG: universal stress protein [Elstera sp.]|jgi:nucleotide-binding universal stress UspA family protein|uniref:universal stress protein n=1 Tax=Elstera sp. TaxID=1916664 RepID=UPI0037BFB556
MRAILAILWTEQTAGPVLALATRLARRFNGRVTGLAIRPAFESFVPSGDFGLALSQEYLDRLQQDGTARLTKLKSLFDAHVGAENISADWMEAQGPSADAIASAGRLFDISVLARPDVGGSAEPEIMLEAALFETGRPIIMAPPTLPETDGTRVLIAWNGSSETARSVGTALPLLHKAEEIHIVSVDSGMATGPSARDVAAYLEKHDLRATYAHMQVGEKNAGAVWLDEAQRLGCDLMIKGAYTQSRLRQMIFGGATVHILNHAKIPVFFAH